MKKLFIILSGLFSLSLVGCVSAPKSLYSWGTFPQQSYLSLSLPEKALPQDQIIKLEKDIEKAKAQNNAVPPGLYAHLGLQYLNSNDASKAIQYFELERQVYPESSILMDRLLTKLTGQTAATGVKK